VVVPVLSMLAEPLPVDLRGDRLRLAGQQRWRRLIARRGPYAVEGEWWAAGFHREYLLLCGADQQRYWVYREGRGWLLQGYLD